MDDRRIAIHASHPHAIYPVRAFPGDAGVDLHVIRDVWLWPFVVRDLPTGWRIKIPNDYVGLVLPRSSTFKRLHVYVHHGVLDSSYTGELSVLVRNLSPWPRRIRFGTRLAQLIVVPCLMVQPQVVHEMPGTDRGGRGFGSTGFGL